MHKKSDMNEYGNFRPISILPAFWKILEYLIKTKLVGYKESKLLHGFRKKKSTVTVMLEPVEAFDNLEEVIVICLDWMKVFVRVSYEKLILKLED
ncbi:hypothetical protein HHI36_022833 [Cryptolaemus montrouzieri]|uniref:Reverse transcriptase n=1 Tax=Cryptolaemus montrouzieri TaxID=559131 RepID=A0ABD2PF86_9CUCU